MDEWLYEMIPTLDPKTTSRKWIHIFVSNGRSVFVIDKGNQNEHLGSNNRSW